MPIRKPSASVMKQMSATDRKKLNSLIEESKLARKRAQTAKGETGALAKKIRGQAERIEARTSKAAEQIFNKQKKTSK